MCVFRVREIRSVVSFSVPVARENLTRDFLLDFELEFGPASVQ